MNDNNDHQSHHQRPSQEELDRIRAVESELPARDSELKPGAQIELVVTRPATADSPELPSGTPGVVTEVAWGLGEYLYCDFSLNGGTFNRMVKESEVGPGPPR